mgnify:CR=1 FL=1
MFEKEAEGYAQVHYDFLENIRAVEDIWQNGAEFGYNKANEWHYVKDGDLPKERCLIYYKDIVGAPSLSIINPTWYIGGIEAFFKNNPQIIAWKEIALPKEVSE